MFVLPFISCGEMHLASFLYDVSSHGLSACVLSKSGMTHGLKRAVREGEAAHVRIPHVLQNDIRFAEISLFHRRHCQHELIAEIDASCPYPPCKHIHPPPLSHLSRKLQRTANTRS